MNKNKNLDSGISMNKVFDYLQKLNIKETYTPEVLSTNGNEFAGLFELNLHKYKKPILVSSTDGVGTKIKIANLAGNHSSIGKDLIAMAINDILVFGAKPLFFLNYFSTSEFNENIYKQVLATMIQESKKLGMVYIGGETAKMPNFYRDNLYDLCGTVIGIVEKDEIIDGKKIQRGNHILGIPSNGFHSNGYSVIQEILFNQNKFELTDKIKDCDDLILKDILLQPTEIYADIIHSLLDNEFKFKINGLAHITGGGLLENSNRILPEGLKIELFKYTWPKMFQWFQSISGFSKEKMETIFNCGIGMVIFLDEKEVLKVKQFIKEIFKLDLIEIGKII